MSFLWGGEIDPQPAKREMCVTLYLEASGFEQQLEEFAGLNHPLI